MKGLDLALEYFKSFGENMIERKFPDYKGFFATGLVGEGSQCLGYDDEISQDHDFEPGFCIWLPRGIYDQIGGKVKEEYIKLPDEFKGFSRVGTYSNGRLGVFEINSFYKKYTNCNGLPRTDMEWFLIPESFLNIAVDGKIFQDDLGEFTEIREGLEKFYPENVLRKKLAARVGVIGQAGQYNYPRSIKRNDTQAAYLACAEFVKAALSTIYLLNRKYMPFYKWAFRGAKELTILKDEVILLEKIVSMNDCGENGKIKENLIEQVSVAIGKELNKQVLSYAKDDFLINHTTSLMSGITNKELSNLHFLVDTKY